MWHFGITANILGNKLLDEGVVGHKCFVCHKCNSTITKEYLIENNFICPACGENLQKNYNRSPNIINFCKIHKPIIIAVLILVIIIFSRLLMAL